MSAYATRTTYDGRRAFVTARVLVRLMSTQVEAGTVTRIDQDRDAPEIVLDGAPVGPGSRRLDLSFVAVRDEAEVPRLPTMSWTWPPRL